MVPGTTAIAEDIDAEFNDIAGGLSDCMTRDGQGPATNNLNMGGFKLQGLGPGTAATDAVNLSQIQGSLPIGVILDWPLPTPPANFIVAQGQNVSRTTYAALFGVIGTTYGNGDGSTTFGLPNTQGRVLAGVDPSGTVLTTTVSPSGASVGASGGEQTHLLITAEIPSHTHTNSLTDPGHTHTYSPPGSPSNSFGAGALAAVAGAGGSITTGSAVTGITITNAAIGGGVTHNNVQPTLVTLKIIKYA